MTLPEYEVHQVYKHMSYEFSEKYKKMLHKR